MVVLINKQRVVPMILALTSSYEESGTSLKD